MATEIGTRIKRARERKRWTQRELAAALKVSIKTVDNWENGRTSPRSSVGALEEVLGVSLDEPEPEPELPPSLLADIHATFPGDEESQQRAIRLFRRALAEGFAEPRAKDAAPGRPGRRAGLAGRRPGAAAPRCPA